MRLGRPLLLAALAVGAAFAACTLNPQPLPPNDDPERATTVGDDASFGSKDSAAPTEPQTPPPGPDGSMGANDGDASPDGTMDGGDGGITDADTDGG